MTGFHECGGPLFGGVTGYWICSRVSAPKAKAQLPEAFRTAAFCFSYSVGAPFCGCAEGFSGP